MVRDTMPRGMQSDRQRGLEVDHGNGGPGKREVDLYVRTYTTLLQSSGRDLGRQPGTGPHHCRRRPSTPAPLEPEPDMNAFIYSVQRLPASSSMSTLIVLGQQQQAFARAGYRQPRQLAGPERARPPSPLALRRRRDPGRLHRLHLRSGRSDPDDRRLPDRVEQDAPDHRATMTARNAPDRSRRQRTAASLTHRRQQRDRRATPALRRSIGSASSASGAAASGPT